MALLSGISEVKILEVKQTEIHEKASQSIKNKGWFPNLFRIKESIRSRLRQLQEQGKQKNQPKQKKKSFDRDSR